MRNSAVLQGVDEVMPQALRSLPAELTRLLDVSGFPDVLAPFAATPITDVRPADPSVLQTPVVAEAQDIDLCLLLGAGWPFHLGGITPYLDRSGTSEKVTGARFLPRGVASMPDAG